MHPYRASLRCVSCQWPVSPTDHLLSLEGDPVCSCCFVDVRPFDRRGPRPSFVPLARQLAIDVHESGAKAGLALLSFAGGCVMLWCGWHELTDWQLTHMTAGPLLLLASAHALGRR